MYAKIMKERELNDISKNRNYMKIIVDKDNYSKDSLILMTIICDEITDVEITTASLSFNL